MADEPLQITYSYWDGAGHRRVLQVRKGDSIGEFLRAVQQQLATEFREVRTSAVENMIYIKEDLIIPHVRLPSQPHPPARVWSHCRPSSSLCSNTLSTSSSSTRPGGRVGRCECGSPPHCCI